ncbi:MAG: prepilin-type N-terminal cleavage/methylation domain-containing protein [Nitrospinaceae bacterium]|nr:type II secretion system protein [Nitrospinaceae bacterium]NIR53786.1 type II secretion system protein [Nitrospinaceae bacterium]NIS84196.1 type II secretion system protein [Nitrospinaceae bacterium]NIT81002.1 type II secretion system protein [Nitrospinaceae bacterium]NIU43292.1 type II secretion system protein [Nitrospinaceae bacterium]
MPRTPAESGFTAIEIILVILLVGILAVVATPALKTSPIDASTAADMVKNDLRFLQALAMARNPQNPGEVGITFTVGQSSYVIDDPQDVFDDTRQLPSRAVISSGGTLSFNKYGEPEFAGASQSFQVSSGGNLRTITVEQITGRVTVS